MDRPRLLFLVGFVISVTLLSGSTPIETQQESLTNPPSPADVEGWEIYPPGQLPPDFASSSPSQSVSPNAAGNAINQEHICEDSYTWDLSESIALTSIYTHICQSLDAQNFVGAIEGYTQVLQSQPNNAQAYLNRGLIYWYLDNRQNAIADLKQASRLFREQGDQTYFPATQELIRQIQSEG